MALSPNPCQRLFPCHAEVKRNLGWASCLANACPGLSWHEGVMHIAGVTRGGWKKRKFATPGTLSGGGQKRDDLCILSECEARSRRTCKEAIADHRPRPRVQGLGCRLKLAQWGEAAETALKNALKGSPTLETRRRVEALLAKIAEPSGERLQSAPRWRCWSASATPEARKVLRPWRRGPLAQSRRTTRKDRCGGWISAENGTQPGGWRFGVR